MHRLNLLSNLCYLKPDLAHIILKICLYQFSVDTIFLEYKFNDS